MLIRNWKGQPTAIARAIRIRENLLALDIEIGIRELWKREKRRLLWVAKRWQKVDGGLKSRKMKEQTNTALASKATTVVYCHRRRVHIEEVVDIQDHRSGVILRYWYLINAIDMIVIEARPELNQL